MSDSMLLFLIFSIVSGLASVFHLPEWTAKIADESQKICAEHVPGSSSDSQFISAMICGTSIQDPELYKIFVQTSLIHVAVVSGSHLVAFAFFLENLFKFFQLKKKDSAILKYPVLFAYCFLCGFQPPVVRSFFSQLFQAMAGRWRLWRGTELSSFWALILCLALMPAWISSASLRMSAVAVIGLELSSFAFFKARHLIRSNFLQMLLKIFLQSLFVQILMFPFLGQFTLRSILFNCIFAPILCWGLLPLCALVFLFPCLQSAFAFLFTCVVQSLKWALNLTDDRSLFFPPVSLTSYWALVLTLSLMILFLSQIVERRRNQS